MEEMEETHGRRRGEGGGEREEGGVRREEGRRRGEGGGEREEGRGRRGE